MIDLRVPLRRPTLSWPWSRPRRGLGDGAGRRAPKLAGTWTWEWKDAEEKTHKHVLEVEGVGAKIAARERFDDLAAIKVTELKLDGKALSFTVQRGDRRSEYKGTVADADTINGTVTVSVNNQPNQFGWTAKRERPAKP